MRHAVALLVAIFMAGVAPASAATVTYVFGGQCISTPCPTGESFGGVMEVDDAGFEANQPVDVALISQLRFDFGADTLGLGDPGVFQAVWGSVPGRLSSLTFEASKAVAPDTGFTAGIWLRGNGGLIGTLTGTSRASLIGNCPAQGCLYPDFGDLYGNYTAAGFVGPGPTPIPLPPAFLLVLAGFGGLGLLRLRRKA